MDQRNSRIAFVAGGVAVGVAGLVGAAAYLAMTRPSPTSTTTPASGISPATLPSDDVGTVQTVLADKRYASASVGAAAEWKVDDEVELTDAAGTVLTTGAVKMILTTRNAVHVKFEPLPVGSRPIASGDRVRRTGRTLPPATTRP